MARPDIGTIMAKKIKELEDYLKTAPKVHFSPEQQFIPMHIYQSIENLEDLDIFPQIFSDASEVVYEHYQMPYHMYEYQRVWVDAFAKQDAAAMYMEVGLGKTLTATVAALYHRILYPGHTLILMPPILIRQWYDWLNKIGGVKSVVMYKGTPKERERLNLDAQFVLMSMDIFKRDFERLYNHYLDKNVTLIVDEAVCVKNPSTQNHKCVWAFHNKDSSKLGLRRKTKDVRPKTVVQERKSKDAEAVSKLKDFLNTKFK